MITGKVESVTLVEHIQSDFSLCEIVIDFDQLKIFGRYNELIGFIGKHVQYDIREDMYKGNIIRIVANLADVYTVQTLDKVEGIRLIPERDEERAVCNFAVSSLKYGDMDFQCIAYLSAFEQGKSNKTKWIDCTMIDKESKAFVLRIFTKSMENDEDAEAIISSYVGHYVKFDINFTKYGYQTDKIEFVNVPVVLPPEVDIAITVIKDAVAGDEELIAYMEQYNYVNTLKNIIDYEQGYHLVRVASEIYMIQTISNISTAYITSTLIRAAITSRGYLLPSKTKFSRSILNVTKVTGSQLRTDRELILILDPFAEEVSSSTKNIYVEIKKMVEAVIRERRGEQDETNYAGIDNSALRMQSGGLL